jgi:hypothetical protein
VFAAIIKEDIAMEHTSTRARSTIQEITQKYLRSDIIHNRRRP